MRLFSVLMLLCASTMEAQSLLTDARQEYDQVKTYILQSAAKMPEEFYSFKPAPRVRTFGQILG